MADSHQDVGGHNPVGVDSLFVPSPRVARSSQPWALVRNPFGIGVGARRAPVDTNSGKRPKKDQPFHSGGKPHAHTLARDPIRNVTASVSGFVRAKIGPYLRLPCSRVQGYASSLEHGSRK